VKGITKMSPFDIPENIDPNALNDGMLAGGQSVQLPFTAPFFYVVNGDIRLKAMGGVPYFGGWSVDAESCLDAAQEYGQEMQPLGFSRAESVGRGNKTIEIFQSRSILVAPIGIRRSWISEDPSTGSIKRAADYFAGARQHTQLLAYVGHKDGIIKPWAPGVLTAKGWQANFLQDAIKAWKNHIEKARKAAAPNVPAWCFYLSLGTFGSEVKLKSVGKGSQSTITPIEAYLPDQVNAELLEKLYVGKQIYADMVALKEDAKEWLEAWGHPSPKAQQIDTIPQGIQEPEFDDYVVTEESFPF
jgi:hypothetical protein